MNNTRRGILLSALVSAFAVGGVTRAGEDVRGGTAAILERIGQQDLCEAEIAKLVEDLSEAEVAKLIENAERIKAHAKTRLTLAQRVERALLKPWVIFGFAAQFAFMMRFVVQLIASERKKRSTVPVAFWYLSLVGGVMLFIYALKLRDPVFVLGQGLGCLIYIRNLLLIYKRHEAYQGLQEERRARAAANHEHGVAPVTTGTNGEWRMENGERASR